MSKPLITIKELRDALASAKSNADHIALWDVVQRLEAELVGGKPCKEISKALEGVKSCVTDAISNCRDGTEQPAYCSVRITALEMAIKRNTIGLDGWPMSE